MILNQETVDTINSALSKVNGPQDINRINELSSFILMLIDKETGGDYNKALAIAFKIMSYYLNELTIINNIIKQNKVN